MGDGLILEGKARILGELFQGLSSYAVEPKINWTKEGRDVANASWRLYATDSVVRALIQARLQLTLGAHGLRFQSKYSEDQDHEDVTAREKEVRRKATALVADTFRGTTCDPSGVMTRYDIEALLALSADIAGDGFALRVWKPYRPKARYGTAWRVLDPSRIKNPPGVANGQRPRWELKKGGPGVTAPDGNAVYEGIEIDPDNTPVAIWVQIGDIGYGYGANQEWKRYEFYDKYGNQNVIHYYEPDQPGAIRGMSKIGAMLVNAGLLNGVQEAHMVGKRLQACHPLFIRSSDEALAAAYQKAGATMGPNTPIAPGMVGFIGEDGEVMAPMTAYAGADFKEFLTTQVMVMSAGWGMPWQWVMAQVEGVSMASGRIYVDKAQQRGERWQECQIQKVTSVIDRSYIREGMVRGLVPKAPLADVLVGSYARPRRPRLNPGEDAKTAAAMLEQGISYSTVYREVYGLSLEDEVAQKVADYKISAPLRTLDKQDEDAV